MGKAVYGLGIGLNAGAGKADTGEIKGVENTGLYIGDIKGLKGSKNELKGKSCAEQGVVKHTMK